jgi:hypothetical protein
MQAVGATFGEVPFHRGRDHRQGLLWLLPWGAALVFGAGLEGWILHARPAAAPEIVARVAALPAPAPAKRIANPYGGLVDAYGPFVNPYGEPPNPYGALVDFYADAKPTAPSRNLSLQASLEAAPPALVAEIPRAQDIPLPPKRDVARIDEAAPLPPPRPAELASLAPDRRAPGVGEAATGATTPADDGNIFAKLFGGGRSSDAAVAYAATESRVATSPKDGALGAVDRASRLSLFGRSPRPTGYDQWTAVYDISARTLYMPDGTQLEAHSGYGDKLDDPRFVSEHARGATPPHLYELTPREDLFHGVQALRLTPIGDGDVFGRAGLLAHPFMLGPNGDSNGCVSIREYDAFLRAYQQGQVKRLAVVAKLD